jgi:CRP-like cAMP-binding protein
VADSTTSRLASFRDPFLNRLELWDRLDLIFAGQRKAFNAGDLLLQAGNPSRGVIIIKSGLVQVTRQAEPGCEAFLRLGFPGEVIGEEALLDLRRPRSLRSLTAKALTYVEAQVMASAEIREFLDSHPQAWVLLAEDLSARLAEADMRITILSCEPADRRLAWLLWDLDRHGGIVQPDGGRRIPIDISQGTLGMWIAASRETVERTFAKWRVRHIIRTPAPRTIVVDDAKALARIARIDRLLT